MTGRKGKKRRRLLLLAAMLALLCVWTPLGDADAAGPMLVIEAIDYENETMMIKSLYTDTKLYYSDAKQAKWECAYGTFEGGYYFFDISWIKKTKDYTLSLKGDKSITPVEVVLPKQQTNFKVTYNYKTKAFAFPNLENGQTVSWRKSNSTKWYPLKQDAASMEETLNVMQRFYAKGTTLCFRVDQVSGKTVNGKFDPGQRPSKEVKLKIAKQPAAPTVTITVSNKTLGLSGTVEYRKAGAVLWTHAESKKLDIKEVAPEAFRSAGQAGKDVLVSFRTEATEKKLESLERDITIKAQEGAPENAEIKFASCTSISITAAEVTEKDEDGKEIVVVEAASSSNPYEYAIVEKDGTLSDSTKWTAIKSASAVKITSQKAPEGSTVYVRKQAHVADKTVYYPESEAKSFLVGPYPEESHADLNGNLTDWVYKDENGVIDLFKTANISAGNNLTFKVVVADVLYPDVDVKSIQCSGSDLEFESVKGTNELAVTITSTEKFEKAVTTRDKAYPVKITLTNGEVLDKCVQLTILRDASLAKEVSLEVVNAPNNTVAYQFTIIPARLVEKEAETAEHKTTTVQTITIPGLKTGETAPTVTFTQTKDGDGNLVVTLNNQSLQAFFTNNVEEDKKFALAITMDNGQEFTSGVSITFTQEATIEGAPYSYTKKADTDFEQNIALQLNYKSPGVRVTSITWNGQEIGGNSSSNSKYILAELDRAKINKLGLPEGQNELTCPIIITFSNGAQVSTGCTLTLQR